MALGTLYDRYRVILFSLLVRILNSREEAEDVLQEGYAAGLAAGQRL